MITVYDANTKLEDLHHIPLRRPEKAGLRWQGIPHGALAKSLIAAIEKRGWEVKDTKFSVSPNETEMAGALDLKINDVKLPEGMSLSLGILTSNAMKRSLIMVAGANVACCLNGMATGQIVMRRKHTIGFNLENEIQDSLDNYRQQVSWTNQVVADLRETELPQGRADRVLMEAGRQRLMPWSRIGKVDKEYRNPTFAEHGKGTSWALLQAFTYHVKKNSPLTQMTSMNRFRGLLPVRTHLPKPRMLGQGGLV
tara:strand:- start:2258 stop:3016 length:759 start_codon:yes stop_codon:yes gene_type:complete